MKKIKVVVYILLINLLLLQMPAKAGFPLGQGHWMLAPTYNYYSASGYWNSSRIFTPYTNNGRFVSNYFGLYGIYGISKNTEFVFNLPFVNQNYTETNLLIQNGSLGDASFGLSFYPAQNDLDRHFSISGSIILPLYQNSKISSSLSSVTPPFVGFQTLGAEAKLGYAGNAPNFIKNSYFDINAGIRQYFSSLGPTQIFFDGTFGVGVDDYWKIYGNLSGVNSTSNYQGTSTDGVNRDYGYFRITAGAGRKLGEQTQLFVSLFQDVSGRNTGKGSGFSLFAVFKF
jgi:hypothetical protein